MQRFEGFTCGKDARDPYANEDQLVVVPEVLYAVVDGATDISGRRFDDRLGTGATAGRLAACAVAGALRRLAEAAFDTPPAAAEVVAAASASVRDTYRRLGIAAADVRSGGLCFRAAFATALFGRDLLRLTCVGDCAIRINGRQVIRHDFPADRVLSAARAAAWRILGGRGETPETTRRAVRQMIVEGLGGSLPPPPPLTAGDIAQVADAVAGDPGVLRELDDDGTRTRRILAAGLEGVRADPGAYNAVVVDGVSDPLPFAIVRDMEVASLETLELFSDGYPQIPSEVSLPAWEAALVEADRSDPERIGAFASTKGRAGDLYGDDRSIAIVRMMAA